MHEELQNSLASDICLEYNTDRMKGSILFRLKWYMGGQRRNFKYERDGE